MHVHLFRLNTKSCHWYAQAYVGGKRHRFSCHTSDKATARKYGQKRLRELEEHFNRGLAGLPETVRMSEVFDRYEREYAPRLRPSGRRRTMFVFQFARDWFVNGPLKDPDVRKVTARDIQSLLECLRQDRQPVQGEPTQAVPAKRETVVAHSCESGRRD
jgi:hypothetical protein